MIRFFTLLFLLFLSFRSLSQDIKLSDIITDIAEELAIDDSAPETVSAYTDKLWELSENPVEINTQSESDISKLFFLSDFQVKAIIDYTNSFGSIVSVYELANLPGFDKQTVEMMLPFIHLTKKANIIIDSVRWKQNLITNITYKHDNAGKYYPGSPVKILSRYKFTSGRFSGGITIEKDQGEKFLSRNPPLPDFYSANLAYISNGVIRKIIVGDYSARFGQGTNINTGIRTALSVTSPGYMSARDEIKPYTSSDESNFFRGIAVEFAVKNFGLALFYSSKFNDATLGSSSGISSDFIESLYLSGLHNSTSLMKKKDVISEDTYGLNFSSNFKNIRVGMVWSKNVFTLPVKPQGNDPEKFFDFTGDRNTIYTLYYNSLIKRILIYGEISTNEFLRFAVVQGLSIRPSDRLTINFLYRNYEPGYTSFHGKGPGSGSFSSNEQGILGNFIFEAAKHIFISGGCDIQQFPWLKYRCSAPSVGIKKELRFRFLPDEKFTFDASYNYRLIMVDKSVSNGIPFQELITTRALKVSFRYALYNNLTLGTRFDYKLVDPSGSNGILMLQELHYSFRKIPISLWIRYCLFSTDNWDSRIYTYENDLLYSFSIPALSGEGSRSYIMAKWDISDYAVVRIKYGLTSYFETGSVLNKDEIKIQLRILF